MMTTTTVRREDAGEAPPTLDCRRVELVTDACRAWTRKLIDPSRRNNLLFFRQLKEGTLDLTDAPQTALAELLAAGEDPIPLEDFVGKEALPSASAKAQEIRRRAQANEEERGLETLHLALGLATWPAADEGRPYAAPVFLLPVEVQQQGTERRRLLLRRSGDIQPNAVLLHYLEAQGINVEAETLTCLVEGDDEGETFNFEPAFEFLRARCDGVQEFAIQEQFVLGNFAFQKMAMVQDLRLYSEAMAAHELIAAIAQDAGAREHVRGERSDVDPADPDRRSPDQEFLVLDADSTQQRAIACALGGQCGVISGPPGTGKSQTIANLIAETAARGQRVLFVAEKRAALEAVFKRLEQKGLGHLCLDLHGADVSRAKVMERLASSLERIREAPPVNPTAVHAAYVERRDRLNRHVEQMHVKRACGSSVFEMQGRLLRLPPEAVAETRWRGAALAVLGSDALETATRLLKEAEAFELLILRTHTSPWTAAALTSGHDARRLLDVASDALKKWRDVQPQVATLLLAASLSPATTLNDLQQRLTLLTDVLDVLASFDAQVFGLPLAEACERFAPARAKWTHWWATFTSGEYRKTRAQIAALWHGPTATPQQQLAVLERARDLWPRWMTLRVGDAGPRIVPSAIKVRAAVTSLAATIRDLDAVLAVKLSALPLETLEGTLAALAADSVTPFQQVRAVEIERELRRMGVGALIDEVRTVKAPAATWCNRLRYAWLRSWLDAMFAENTEISAFRGRTHDTLVEEFTSLDRDRLALAVARVLRTHAENVITVRNRYPDQDALVKKEAAKKRRHLPLRRVFREAPDVMMALHPCWMASPLSVSQLLPADRQYFDLVIFDEASQVLPEDAVTAIFRGKRAVVAGDRRQLPPTTFFAAGSEEEGDEETATGGFESLLDVMSSFLDPAWGLDWHYRSRDESLISFSNRHVYADRLVTFPGAVDGPVLSHVLVPHIPSASNEDSSSGEVDRVVQLVIDHGEKRPQESLGVIAMGLIHARRVEAAIDRVLQGRPDLAPFFDGQNPERFFVKNLERVQGDEREAIILTIGYGKDASGKLPYRFGPLLSDGGERRLNVAITRARGRMTLVSSFSHLDMDPARSTGRGVELLRAYLEYASHGGTRHTGGENTQVPLNDFEQAVCDALTATGIKVMPQWGASKYRIDLVAQHPDRPGRFVLAIECDGATYHSSATARDRDRLRQQHLEALGWRFHRIWSTDWFVDRQSELDRFQRAYAQAVADADRLDGDGGARVVPPKTNEAVVDTAASRPPRPVGIGPRGSIDDYSERELDWIVRWVMTGALKTDEEIVADVTRELGFRRRGTRIVGAIERSIARVRRGH